jgi:hypothetical protein
MVIFVYYEIVFFFCEQFMNNTYNTKFLLLSRHITPFFGFWNIPCNPLTSLLRNAEFLFYQFLWCTPTLLYT